MTTMSVKNVKIIKMTSNWFLRPTQPHDLSHADNIRANDKNYNDKKNATMTSSSIVSQTAGADKAGAYNNYWRKRMTATHSPGHDANVSQVNVPRHRR